MKRKRTNLKQYIGDRWIRYAERKLQKDCHDYIDKMNGIVHEIYLDGVNIRHYGVIVVDDATTFKLKPHPTAT